MKTVITFIALVAITIISTPFILLGFVLGTFFKLFLVGIGHSEYTFTLLEYLLFRNRERK